MAAAAVCILEVVLPINGQSYQEIPDYKKLKRRSVRLEGAESKIKNIGYLVEHPTDIVLSGEAFDGQFISILVFVHMGTRLSAQTLERVINELICEPVTITNAGYNGSINCTLLFRSLGDVKEKNRAYPLVFSVKSSDIDRQLFFETFKY